MSPPCVLPWFCVLAVFGCLGFGVGWGCYRSLNLHSWSMLRHVWGLGWGGVKKWCPDTLRLKDAETGQVNQKILDGLFSYAWRKNVRACVKI